MDHKRKENLSLFNHQPESRKKVPSDARLRDYPRHGVGMNNSTFFLDFILTSEEIEPGEKAYFFIVFCNEGGLDTLEINVERQGLTKKWAPLKTNKVAINRKKNQKKHYRQCKAENGLKFDIFGEHKDDDGL